MKILNSTITTFSVKDGQRTELAKLTKHRDKNVKDQEIFRMKLSMSNQCKDLSVEEPGVDEVELNMIINNKPFYWALFKAKELVKEVAQPLTVV